MNQTQFLSDAADEQKLKRLLRRYLSSCRPPEGEEKKGGRFPNLAGFFRWIGCGLDALEQLRLVHPEAADYLVAVMEDEALNSPAPSPTVVSAYLKRRLFYGEKPSAGPTLADCGEVRLVFEHDIDEDGL